MKNDPSLSMFVPEPAARPGEQADFSKLEFGGAGCPVKPGVDCTALETRDHAYGLIRVMDDAGKATGPWNPKVDAETLKKGLKAMILTRAFDERMFRQQRQGKTSFYMKCLGEEAIACAQALVLEKDDMCFPTYRQQGLLITRGYPLVAMMNQI